MAKLSSVPRLAGRKPIAAAPGLPDPRRRGPFRPFATDPGWHEAWWWLAIPALAAAFVLVSYRIDPAWHGAWVTRESGLLETGQFIFMVMGLAIAVQLLFDPFVRRRPLILAATAGAVLACFYIGGEEVSWGQHIFFWQSPGLVTEINGEGEFSLHNVNKAFERAPRTVLELGVLVGGIFIPLACAFAPNLRRSRLALFLPGAALMPLALFALFFKLAGTLSKHGLAASVAARPSEAVEFYMYFFIFAYLVTFERRIRALAAEGAPSGAEG